MDKRILIGIISYLPNDVEKRKRRLKSHNTQLEWIKNVFGTSNLVDIKCIYQCYTQEEIPKLLNSNEYDLYDYGLHIAPARNKILDYFYNNDVYDVCAILDDDSLLYNYYGIENFLVDLLNSDNKYVNIVTTLSPRKMPFKEVNTKYKDIIEDNWVFSECPPQVNGFYILYKNIKKHGVYFKDLDIHKNEGFEDVEFLLNLIRHGVRIYMCSQLITRTLSDDDSTWVDSYEQRLAVRAANQQALCEQYSDLGIRRKYRKDGSFAGFSHPVCISDQPKTVMIKRGVHYTTPDNLIYTKRSKLIKPSLF